ncbi:MAG: response regulator, partial [Alphaproteobacteria bacterium]
PGQLGGQRRPTILQIDDDEDLVRVVAAAFDGEARVVRANGVASARAVLDMEPPDIVVLDIGLPDGSGLDLIPALVDRAGEPLPTIVFTAQDCPAELRARVEAVLIKSRSSIPTLRDTIRRIVAERANT